MMKRHTALAVVLMLSCLTYVPSADAAFRRSNKPIKGRYIVVLRSVPYLDVESTARSLTRQFSGRLIAVMKHGRSFGVGLSEPQAIALSRNPLVQLVEEDGFAQLANAGTQPTFDFATVAASRLGQLKRTTTANMCPWTGSFFTCSYGNDTLWYLDRLDNQGLINNTKAYAYSSTGNGVRVYVVDTGVYAAHNEFGPGQVELGANMTMDPDTADAQDPNQPNEEYRIALDPSPANNPCGTWTFDVNHQAGHGTGVASVLGGTTRGVAKDVTIVPVKVMTCGGEMAKLSIARGLDWIQQDMADADGDPTNGLQPRTQRAVVTMSVFVKLDTYVSPNTVRNELQECEDGAGGYTNCVSAIEHEINQLMTVDLSANPVRRGIPVVVSANNQDDGTCRTSPARMGYGNEVAFPSTYRTITVGGTMAFAQNGYADNRWTCNGTPEDCQAGWSVENRGSNFGPCVSIWAPAWSMQVAGSSGPSSYRGPGGPSSGTSYSAPYVAGIVARLLERNPTWTSTQVWNELTTRANQRWTTPPFGQLVYISPFE